MSNIFSNTFIEKYSDTKYLQHYFKYIFYLNIQKVFQIQKIVFTQRNKKYFQNKVKEFKFVHVFVVPPKSVRFHI